MKCCFLVLCSVMIVVAVSSVPTGEKKSIGSTCKDSRECYSRYCRDEKCINYGDAADDKGRKNPCIPNPCYLGEPCVLQQVKCSKSPCRPIARCWGDDYW